MADVRPIHATHYDLGVVGSLQDVAAPPYDVIDADMRTELLARSPYNAVAIDLPKPYGETGPQQTEDDPYERAARTMEEWRQAGALVADSEPAIWAMTQDYTGPDGTPRTRHGILARVRVEDFSAGQVLPHERTLPGPKKDRLDLTRATREGLLDTPKRAAKAMQYLCRGYEQTLEEVTNGALFSSDNSEMVLVKDIELYSLCEHHLLPFIGKAHVAYIPSGKVLGLSKVARIVDMYARRLQIQENLSRQIADAVMQVTGALGVAVVIEAKHMCMMMRGVEKQNSSMITSVMLGEFRENAATRSEFLSLIK